MREHQIIISLKPDQFLLVQRLAREAGAKSMGLFVRQQLLIALGIEGSAASSQSSASASDPSGPDLEPIKNELKFLHAQLREIVAESITNFSDSLVDETVSEPVVDFAEALPSAPGASADDTAGGANSVKASELLSSGISHEPPHSLFEVDDELEEAAKKTFAISPRLGEFDTSIASEAPVEPDIQQSFTSNIDSRNMPAFSQQFRASESESASRFVSEPNPLAGRPVDAAAEHKMHPRGADPLKSSSPASPIIQRQSGDTPRDPLSDLLDSSDADSAKPHLEESDDESFDVPLSIMTRRRQMEALAKSLAESSQNSKADNLAKPGSSQPPQRPNKPDLSEKESPPEKPAQTQQEVPKPVDSQSVSGTYQHYNPLGNPDEDSPFSGGPPPKKRQ